MDRTRRELLSALGTTSLIIAAGCSTTEQNTSTSGENNGPSSLKDVVETQKEIENAVDCDNFDTDAIFRIESTGVHSVTKSEELAKEMKSYISQSANNDSVNIQIANYGNESSTFYVVEAPPNVLSHRDLGEEFYESEDYVAVRKGQSVKSVTNYFQQIESYLEDISILEDATMRIHWPEPTDPIEATATIDGVNQMTDFVEEDLIQGRVPMESGEETVFSTSDFSSITSPKVSHESISVYGSFSTKAQKRVFDRFRETDVITDSGKGENELHFYVCGEDMGAPKILPEAIEGWNESGKIEALGIPIEVEDARRFYERFPNLDVMDPDGEIKAEFTIKLCE